MSIYKPIKPTDVTLKTEQVYYKHTLSGGTEGLNLEVWTSGSGYFTHPITLTELQTSQSINYHFLRSNFYITGSGRLNSPVNFGQHYSAQNPQHRNKFQYDQRGDQSITKHGGKILSISQKYFGEQIRPGTFKLIDGTITPDSDSYSVIIKDDGYGNLYATNAIESQSAATSLSSSDNYVGNIFYEAGIAAITTNELISGSATRYLTQYSDNPTNFTASFESVKSIYTREYTLSLKANEFNMTNNPSIKKRDRSFTNTVSSSDWGPQPHFQVTNSDLPIENISVYRLLIFVLFNLITLFLNIQVTYNY